MAPAILMWEHWLIPIILTVIYVAPLWKFREKIPEKIAGIFGPLGGGINALGVLLLGGAIATGTATVAAWILFIALCAQLATYIADMELKRGMYPKLAGSGVMVWQFFMFFTVVGIAVTGLVIPPELGQIIPISTAFDIGKFVLPILIVGIMLLTLYIVKVPEKIAASFALGGAILYPIENFAKCLGATIGIVVLPLYIALIPVFGMMVRAVYDFSYEKHWTARVGTSVILAEIWFLALFFAGIKLG